VVDSVIHVSASEALRERQLSRLLAGRPPSEALLDVVRDAQVLGSLELSGFRITWEELRGSGQVPVPEAAARMRSALRAVRADSPLGVGALLAWHDALLGGSGLRRQPASDRNGASPAPPERIAERLANLGEWLETEAGRALAPARRGALALARVVEIRPFDDANARIARLAASHAMERAGSRPPIFVLADAPRLAGALAAAFGFDTGPLCALLEEAAGRATSVMVQAIERGLVRPSQ
jgi:hypothetical protein